MSEIGEIKTAIDLMDSMIRSGEDHSERSLATLTEARKQLDALTTGSCDMSEAPERIWVKLNGTPKFYESPCDDMPLLKCYIRADIHAARIKELEAQISEVEENDT